ncbi:hypothetical protein KI387_029382, partial [Taxus chinensis]
MSLTSTGFAARRVAQQERVRILYRRSLKNALSWVVRRQLFWEDASRVRDEFEANRHVDDIDRIDRMIEAAEAKLTRWSHPDPYIVPWAPKGSKFARNPPVPEVEIVFDYGLE